MQWFWSIVLNNFWIILKMNWWNLLRSWLNDNNYQDYDRDDDDNDAFIIRKLTYQDYKIVRTTVHQIGPRTIIIITSAVIFYKPSTLNSAYHQHHHHHPNHHSNHHQHHHQYYQILYNITKERRMLLLLFALFLSSAK